MAKDRKPGTEADFITAVTFANNQLIREAEAFRDNSHYWKGYIAAVNDFRDSALHYLREGVPEGSFDEIVIDSESDAEIIPFPSEEKTKP